MSVHELARRWWSGELGVRGTLLDVALAPAELAYRGVTRVRNAAYDHGVARTTQGRVPVVSIGNIAVGGTGKTPFANWVARWLQAHGERPAILHGAYARDEPMLHRRWTPEVIVVEDANRSVAARRAVELGASVLVLDDGFQHRRLRRDLDIVLVAAERWQRNARLLPRGPWREPPRALTRAHVVVVTRKTSTDRAARAVAREVEAITGATPVRAHLHASGWSTRGAVARPPEEPAVLVAGVAEPGLVRETARHAGAAIADEVLFADHREYTPRDVRRILATAAGRPLITTEKDWVKLEAHLAGTRVFVLMQAVAIEEGEDLLTAALQRVLS